MLRKSPSKTTGKSGTLRLLPSPSPFLTTLALVLTDMLGVALSFLLSARLWELTRPLGEKLFYFQPLAILWFFPMAYAASGLYPGVGIRPAEELKRLTVNTSLVFLLLAASVFLFKELGDYSRGVLVHAWGMSLLLVPLIRTLIRNFCARAFWWGVPVIVLESAGRGHSLIARLQEQPGLGFKPVALIDTDRSVNDREFFAGVPVSSPGALSLQFVRYSQIRHAIMCLPEVAEGDSLVQLQHYASIFPYLILVPRFFDSLNLWVTARDLGGILGLEVKHNLLFPSSQLCKRAIDLLLTIGGGIAILPLLLSIACMIRLDSPGPILFSQERLGKDGRRFRALKFRSMYQNAEAKLQEILDSDRELRREYEIFHKLRNDPRVTFVGRFLRKYSLDELPQLWNVLRGEMSLVGPRAYMPRELPKMADTESIILRVLPGVTGLWQVRGRSECSFQQRLELDIYYVRNWSLSLDAYILATTLRVVLQGKGAY